MPVSTFDQLIAANITNRQLLAALVAGVDPITHAALSMSGGSVSTYDQLINGNITEQQLLAALVAQQDPIAKTTIAGLKGPKGDTGNTGAAGATGAQGIQGATGAAGAAGATGPAGPSNLLAALVQNQPRTYGSIVPRGDGLFSLLSSGILIGGTSTIAGTNVYFSDTHGNANEWGTGAVSGQSSSWSSASGQIQLQFKPALIVEFGVDSVATGRVFIGFGGPASATSMVDSDDPHAATSPYVGLTYSKGTRNDTNFQFVVCKDNTGQTLVDTGVAVGVGPWFVSIDGSDGATVTVKLYDSTFTQVATHTFPANTLPATNVSMRDVVAIEATNATDRRIRVYQIHKVMAP